MSGSVRGNGTVVQATSIPVPAVIRLRQMRGVSSQRAGALKTDDAQGRGLGLNSKGSPCRNMGSGHDQPQGTLGRDPGPCAGLFGKAAY